MTTGNALSIQFGVEKLLFLCAGEVEPAAFFRAGALGFNGKEPVTFLAVDQSFNAINCVGNDVRFVGPFEFGERWRWPQCDGDRQRVR